MNRNESRFPRGFLSLQICSNHFALPNLLHHVWKGPHGQNGRTPSSSMQSKHMCYTSYKLPLNDTNPCRFDLIRSDSIWLPGDYLVITSISQASPVAWHGTAVALQWLQISRLEPMRIGLRLEPRSDINSCCRSCCAAVLCCFLQCQKNAGNESIESQI